MSPANFYRRNSLATTNLPKICGVLTTICLAFLLGGCEKAKDSPGFGSPPLVASAYFKTHWQDESQFIAEMIGIDLAEMVFFAKYEKLPSSREFSVSASELKTSAFRAP